MEIIRHDRNQTVVVLLLRPEETGQILNPFEVRSDNTAGIGEEIRNDQNPLGIQNSIRLGSQRTIGTLYNILRLNLIGIFAVNRSLQRAWSKDIRFKKKNFPSIHFLESGLFIPIQELLGMIRHVCHCLLDIDTIGTVVAARHVGDGDHFCPGINHINSTVGSDIPKTLDNDRRFGYILANDFQKFFNAGCNAHTRRCRTPL